jgi:hypothetical protein
LARLTWISRWAKSIASQRKVTAAAAFINFCTSTSVRYSRARASAFGRRAGAGGGVAELSH